MCRFSGELDPGYRKIRGVLTRYLFKRSLCTFSMLCSSFTYTLTSIAVVLDREQCKKALSILDYRETQLRIEQVEPAHAQTFQWLFEETEFTEWLKDEQPLYWLQGKPASGKSTLMRFALYNNQTVQCINQSRGPVSLASFFFHDRGSTIQKSLDGLLRGLIYKILTDIPSLQAECLSSFVKDRKGLERGVWTLMDLEATLESILSQQFQRVNLFIFIDALDEYSGKHADIVDFLDKVINQRPNTKSNIKICFSSRPLQIFLDRFNNVPGIVLQKWTASDIFTIINSRFNSNPRMLQYLTSSKPMDIEMCQKLALEILDRAEGVFLWVRLVLDDLFEEFTAGGSIDQLYERLLILPRDLEDLYQRIVDRIPRSYRTDSWIMFELLKCTMAPLYLSDFIAAFRCALAVDAVETLQSLRFDGYNDVDEMIRLIHSRSGGLIEVNVAHSIVIPTFGAQGEYDSDRHSDTGCNAEDLSDRAAAEHSFTTHGDDPSCAELTFNHYGEWRTEVAFVGSNFEVHPNYPLQISLDRDSGTEAMPSISDPGKRFFRSPSDVLGLSSAVLSSEQLNFRQDHNFEQFSEKMFSPIEMTAPTSGQKPRLPMVLVPASTLIDKPKQTLIGSYPYTGPIFSSADFSQGADTEDGVQFSRYRSGKEQISHDCLTAKFGGFHPKLQVQFIHQTVKTHIRTLESKVAIDDTKARAGTGYLFLRNFVLASLERYYQSGGNTLTWVGRSWAEHLLNYALQAEHSTGKSHAAALLSTSDHCYRSLLSFHRAYEGLGLPSPQSGIWCFSMAAGLSLFLQEQLQSHKITQMQTSRLIESSTLKWSVFRSRVMGLSLIESSQLSLNLATVLVQTTRYPMAQTAREAAFVKIFVRKYATHQEQSDLLTLFLTENIDPNFRLPEQLLTEHRFITRSKLSSWFTPLHLVVEQLQDHLTTILLKHGANVNSLNSLNRTPLDVLSSTLKASVDLYFHAAQQRDQRAMQYFLERLSQKLQLTSILLDNGGKSNMPVACEHDMYKTLGDLDWETLRNEGLDVDERTYHPPRLSNMF
jgi:hypothetical protein